MPPSSDVIGAPSGRQPHASHIFETGLRELKSRCSRCNLYLDSPAIFNECPAVVQERAELARALGRGSVRDRVMLSREAAAVERCHQLPHLMRYSVGHHSHDVVSLIVFCWKAAHKGELPRAELLVGAHYHDHPERVWGDVPAPVKDLLAGSMDYAEEETLRRLGISVVLTDEELAYLDAADRVELFLWAIEERDRGNLAALTFVEARRASFEKRPLPEPFAALVADVETNGLGRLPGDLTRDWGGR